MNAESSLSLSEQLRSITAVDSACLKEPYSGVQAFYSVEYEYDHYGCTGYRCGQSDDYDDYCRDAEYENIRIEGPVDARGVLAEIFGVKTENVPQELVTLAENELSLDEADSYEVEVSNGYYGEEAKVVLSEPETVTQRLLEYYFSRKDAIDTGNILPYLRGKGFQTAGLTPLDAVKSHLREENKGKIVDYVENATSVCRKTLSISEVKIAQLRHFENVEPRSLTVPKGAVKTCGVVVQRGKEYVLVDGYHRVKYQKAKGVKTSSFIVLS